MTEIWLRANRRVLLWALVPATAIALIGGLLAGQAASAVIQVAGWIVLAIGGALIVGLVHQLRQPRISYRDGQVRFHLRAGLPVEAPLEIVEAFFLGQGPANLPAAAGKPAETVNLVARLSQKAPEWAQVDVKPALGRWCEGYVTIRGTWCEPLSGEVIRRLNRRLREMREAARQTSTISPAELETDE